MRPSILLVIAACLRMHGTHRQEAAPPTDLARALTGEAIIRTAQCGRCHGGAGVRLEPAPREKSCAGCHAWIHATRDDETEREIQAQIYPKWNQYVDHVKSYLAVPDLGAAGARLDPVWVSAFLRDPVKVRPGFAETMIRTPLRPDEADAVAAFLHGARRPLAGVAAAAAALPVSARAEDVSEGERLYAKLQCARCHAFGARAAQPGVPDAPDLALARRRMRPGDIAAFVADPTAFGGGGAQRMPSYGLPARDAARLRDFLVGAPLAPEATLAATRAALPPVLPRRVTWEEVNERVFAAVCSHCHSDGKLTGGDGGPGNTGGLGYAGAGVDLGGYRGIQRGARRSGGRRVSLLVAEPGQQDPPLLARLRRRVDEHAAELAGRAAPNAAGAPGAGPGMPLGQPPLDEERLQLVRTWLAQGAPGPNKRAAATAHVRISSLARASRATKED